MRSQAAGCVVRHGDRVAVIHRPRYDDWSLPKGKLDPGETFEAAAVREVEEEIGVRGTLGEELQPTLYTDHKGRTQARALLGDGGRGGARVRGQRRGRRGPLGVRRTRPARC